MPRKGQSSRRESPVRSNRLKGHHAARFADEVLEEEEKEEQGHGRTKKSTSKKEEKKEDDQTKDD